MIILSIIKTTLRGSFNHNQTKYIQNGGWMQRGGEYPKNQNWGCYGAKCLVEIWVNEEIQRELSAMGRNQNIWENIAAKLKKCKKFMRVTSNSINYTLL